MSFFPLRIHRNRCRLGLCPTPHWGSLQCSPTPSSCFQGARFVGGGERRTRGRERGEGRGKGKWGGEGKDRSWGNSILIVWGIDAPGATLVSNICNNSNLPPHNDLCSSPIVCLTCQVTDTVSRWRKEWSLAHCWSDSSYSWLQPALVKRTTRYAAVDDYTLCLMSYMRVPSPSWTEALELFTLMTITLCMAWV